MAQFNPPEGYLYDENSGLYYTQIIARDENGIESQVVTWFDAENGQYSQEVYPIDENTTFIDDEEIEYIDEYKTGHNPKPVKGLSKGALIGIIAGGIVMFALIIGVAIFAVNMLENRNKSSKEEIEETDDREDVDVKEVNSDEDSSRNEKRNYPDETETEGWIILPENGGRIPRAKDIEGYSVYVEYANSLDATNIQVWNVGNMESDFLCNPDGYSNGDIVYMWSIVLSNKCGIIVTGRAHNCDEEKIWEPVNPQYYTAQLVYEKNGEKVYEDIDLGFGDECILLDHVRIPDDVGVDFTKLDPNGKDVFEVRNQIGPYKYDGVYVPVYTYLNECDVFVPSNRPHEEKSYDSSNDSSYDSAKDIEYESAEEYTEEELLVMEEAGYGQPSSADSSNAKSTASPQAGLPAEGFYRSDDGLVKMDIMDNGVIYYYDADSMKYEGWYTYDGGGSGYADQGGIYNLHVHFGTPNGELRMELQIDTEVSGLQVISGPGNYGNGWLWLG